jgi:hypothetical protein
MKLYRFSPIENRAELLEAITYIHFACHKLCAASFQKYLPVAGNITIFCHYDAEFDHLVTVRKELCEPSADPKNRKYFRLHQPIIIPAGNDVPETAYTHLYIRKPDIYRAQAGDLDFYIAKDEYDMLKRQAERFGIKGARVFPRNDLDMIELYDPDVDVLAYVSTATMTEKARIKVA